MPNTNTNAHARKKRVFANAAWQTIYDNFLKTLANPLTRSQYGYVVQRLFAFIAAKYGSQRTPDKITQADIEAFLHEPAQIGKRTGQTVAPATANTYLNALTSFYAYCTQQKILFRGKMVKAIRKDVPTKQIKLRARGEVARDFTDGELEAFFAHIDTSTPLGKRDRALFLTLLLTGRRRREISTLRRGDLEELHFIEQGRTRIGWSYSYLGKRRVSKETAEMPGACIEAIRHFHEAAGLDFETEAAEHPLFFGLDGRAKQEQPLCLQQVDKRFRFYAQAAGISEDVVVHSLRYEYAWNRYQENGHDVLEVQEAVGWRTAEQAAHYIRRRKRKQAGDPMAERLSARFAHL